jgi:hypothetical protein
MSLGVLLRLLWKDEISSDKSLGLVEVNRNNVISSNNPTYASTSRT